MAHDEQQGDGDPASSDSESYNDELHVARGLLSCDFFNSRLLVSLFLVRAGTCDEMQRHVIRMFASGSPTPRACWISYVKPQGSFISKYLVVPACSAFCSSVYVSSQGAACQRLV